MIRWLLVSWAANALVLGIAGGLLSGMTFEDSATALIVSAAVFGGLNTIVKPLLKLITLPVAIITLGIAWFFVAMFMLWLTQLIVPKFEIHGFSNYIWATIIVWAVNVVLDVILRPRARTESPAPA
jgi:putative membrane protein